MSSIVAVNTTLAEPLNASALAVISPSIEKFLLLVNVKALVAAPVTGPLNPVAVIIPVDGLYDKPVSDSTP